MRARRGPTLPALLLAAAGVGIGVLGAHAIRLEGDLARRRARARSDQGVRDLAAIAPTRVASGAAAAVGRVRLGDLAGAFVRATKDVPEDGRLLFDQALYLERRGATADARALYARLAARADLGALRDVAAAHATAAALRDAATRAVPAPPTPAGGVTEDDLPLAPWCAWLRLEAARVSRAPTTSIVALLRALLASPDVDLVRRDGGPDGGDLVRRARETFGRDADLPADLRDDLDARASHAAAVQHGLGRLAGAPVAVVSDWVLVAGPPPAREVRLVPAAAVADALSESRSAAIVTTADPASIPADASRAQAPPPLDGLWVYEIPDPGPLAGSGPWWLLGTALLLYTLAATATVVALERSRRAQRMKDDFMAAVSHEMKTPIAGVSAMAEMLADGRVTDPDRARLYAERIRVEMERLGATVRDVLDAARIERDPTNAISPRHVDPADVVREAAAMVRPALERRGFTVDADVRPSDGLLSLDPDAVAHVLHNLLDNAAKFGDERKEIALRAFPRDGGYRIEVLDRGPGVPEAERTRVFDRFVRGERARTHALPGVGLGLHVARVLVEAHGGTIVVDARDGGGARFVVDLPERTS